MVGDYVSLFTNNILYPWEILICFLSVKVIYNSVP